MGMFSKDKRILVLGGGAARGLVNIGVLRVLEETFGRDDFPFDMILGSSIGSLVGAAYCLGIPVEEIEEKALNFKWPELVDLGIRKTGLLKGKKLEDSVRSLIENGEFPDMRIPFGLTTTDIENGEELTHVSGDLTKLICASCSWPGIFSAVEVDGRLLADGGVRNSVPTKAAQKLGSTFMMAVNPGFSVKTQKIDNVLKAFVQSIQIMGEELNMYQSYRADVVVKPELKDIDQFDFGKAREIIDQGVESSRKVMPNLRKKLRLRRFRF